ncbi:MAG: response regulator [Acidobacteria bacterium]|nr:MAG: response regulator [Acidobacteriota bacterium]
MTAASGQEGVKLAAENLIDVVVTDYEMPGMDGEAVAIAVKSLHPRVPVVLFSGSSLVSARALRVVDACCDKAGSRNQLSSTIYRMLQKKRSRGLQPPPVSRASDVEHRTVA